MVSRPSLLALLLWSLMACAEGERPASVDEGAGQAARDAAASAGVADAPLADGSTLPEADGAAHDAPAAEAAVVDANALSEHIAALGYAEFAGSLAEGPSGVVHHDRALTTPGYALYSVVPLSLSVLIDTEGRVFNSWRVPDGHWTMRCELLPDGDVLIVGTHGAAVPRQRHLMRMGWDGELVWRRDIAAHHDVELTPRGEILTLVGTEREGRGVHGDESWADSDLVLLDLDGHELDRLSLLDMLDARPDLRLVPAPSKDLDDALIDPLHANSVEWMPHPELGEVDPFYRPSLVLVSLRHQSRVVAVDWERRAIAWHWGQGIVRQHEATLTPEGRVLLFDNGGRQRRHSRVVEVDPLSGRVTWSWTADPPERFYSPGRGTVQPLPGGNVLVSNSSEGEAFELTRDGELAWRWLSPHFNRDGRRGSIRMRRYEPAFIEPILAARGVDR
ncbi:MAG: hypothetical protein DRQ55_15345 [Planctomycetota bacterium]|nr:MAG: hypothetical protein DRQ55_15345 [Planctomycetota bacterium]